MRLWIGTSICGVWISCEREHTRAPGAFSADSIRELFFKLVRPEHEEDDMTCIPAPAELLTDVGTPPRRWNFIGFSVMRLFADWGRLSPQSRSNKLQTPQMLVSIQSFMKFSTFSPG